MRAYPVTVLASVAPAEWAEGAFVIRLHDGGFRLVLLTGVEERPVATCARARPLSEWALGKGAPNVRWDFDLREAEQ